MATTKTKKKTAKAPKPRAKKLKYNCLKCPGYCCSYPVIEVKDRDAARIDKHFGLPLEKAEKK